MRSDVPPEAYSKEMLSEAFNWLQTQPDAVRELVQTPEYLVALYRKHQAALANADAPVSAKQFVSELKNLAKGLDQFREKPGPSPDVSAKLPPIESQFKPASPAFIEHKVPAQEQPRPKLQLEWQMDERTLETLKETTRRLNLSGEHEALRLLVALGQEKLTQL